MDISQATEIHPRQLMGVKAYELWDEMVLYSPVHKMAFSLNSSARAVWDLCNGKRTLVEISQELGQRFNSSESELLSDVKATVIKLGQLGLLEL
jgi:hypothetical protein